MKSHVFILFDVILLVRLQENFELDHPWDERVNFLFSHRMKKPKPCLLQILKLVIS